MENELLTLAEAAKEIGISQPTLSRAARLGTLKAIKKGKTWLVTRASLEAWIVHAKHKPGPAKSKDAT